MRFSSRPVLAAGLLALCVSCSFIQGDRKRGQVEPAPAPAAEAAPPAPKGPPTYACPDGELTVAVEAPRKIDTRRAGTISVAAKKKIRWPAEHWKAPPKTFFRTVDEALTAAVAIEAGESTLIPEQLRAEILARPRDPALRLRAAACEVKQGNTRRRATYDAAIALLLGAPADEATRLLVLGTRIEEDHLKKPRFSGLENATVTNFCGGSHPPCADGSYCAIDRGECITREQHIHSYISEPEADLEDALTRALLRQAMGEDGPDVPEAASNAWMKDAIHRCGKQICKLSPYSTPQGDRIVQYDRRDGGSVEIIPPTPAELRMRARCMNAIGYPSRDACKHDCWSRFGGYEPRGQRVRDACERACANSVC